MSVLQASCPSCAAPIEFKAGSTIVVVCPFCRSAVGRTDRGLEDIGKVAEIADSESPLKLGLKGEYKGARFELTPGQVIDLQQRGLPLPLGAVHNQRSFVALENLVSLVLLCADRERSPLAANRVFVVADGEDVSTSTLLRKVARAAGAVRRQWRPSAHTCPAVLIRETRTAR